MYSTIPEFSAAVLLDSLKLIIMMCGIFNFSIKKEKKWLLVSIGVAVCLTSVFAAVPLLLNVDPTVDVIFSETDRPAAYMIARIFSLNSASVPFTVFFSVLHLLTGKKKMLLLLLWSKTASLI